ncbi:hypothetical protein PSAC2689_100304 [Paraburkholderia sacchari]
MLLLVQQASERRFVALDTDGMPLDASPIGTRAKHKEVCSLAQRQQVLAPLAPRDPLIN